MNNFDDTGLHKLVLKGLTEQGYSTPTPIQAQAIPALLEERDLLGIAQTGTGKTAAFALPTLHKIATTPSVREVKSACCLVLAPTRELALQISESFKGYSKYMDCVVQTVFGGIKINRQIRNLHKGCHVLVATPGRLLDLMNQEAVSFPKLETLILDEADQMLDMGFIRDLNKIVGQLPKTRQTILFSATMPKLIEDLTQRYLKEPVRISVTPESTTAERVSQGVLHVSASNKLALLGAVLQAPDIDRALVFTRTKHTADKVVRKLLAKGIQAQAIHGNKSQGQRVKALDAFRAGTSNILIATDIAARGIDVDGISHVINFEMPNVAEQYVHRIGRTARAGRAGIAISFVAEDELYYLREIEKITRLEIDVLNAPAECESLLLPEPDRSARVRKPKLTRGGGGRPSKGPSSPRPQSKHKGDRKPGGTKPTQSKGTPRRRKRAPKPARQPA